MLGRFRQSPHLPFDVLTTIAHISIPVYRALLAIPRFGRASLVSRMRNHQYHYQSHFTEHYVSSYGTQEWLLNGYVHSPLLPDGSTGPAIIWGGGVRDWCYRNEYHRVGGPAIVDADGSEQWYRYGQRHREDGPAIVDADGTQKYYLNGKKMSKAEHAEAVRKLNTE
jgi:hypothetical protein